MIPRRLLVLGWCMLFLWTGSAPAAAQRFLPDDPLQEDPDRLDAPVPAEWEASDIYDFVENVFRSPDRHHGPALNVNTLGDVPNSSWYTMRHYWQPMTIDELRRVPDTVEGPSTEQPWQVVSGKSEGKSAGMQIIGARGDRYLLKFDPQGYQELSTSAEVVSTKFFHALGYHVPENYVVRFDRGQLVPGEESGMSQQDIEELLQVVPAYSDGTYRALASRFIDGVKPIGPFLYYGTRPDDANDIFPHEGRRELRGLRVFAAWLNHDDARSINSLDMVVAVEQDTFVLHHLIDFGSTLGGGPLGPKDRWAGYEYALDWGPMFSRAFTLGFASSDWVDIEYPDYPSIGHFEAEHFDPRRWKPQYPNPAFSNMDAADAFWAAKQVMAFTDEQIRAIVATGDYSDPEAAEYLAQTLMKRRDKIGEVHLHFGGGLDRFAVEGGRLVFEDLPAAYGLASANRMRSIIWRPYDNLAQEAGDILAVDDHAGTTLVIPRSDSPFLQAEIRTSEQGVTYVYLRRTAAGHEVVGIDRTGATR